MDVEEIIKAKTLIEGGQITRLSQIPFELFSKLALSVKGIGSKKLRKKKKDPGLWVVGEIIEIGHYIDVDEQFMLDLLIRELQWKRNGR